MKDLARSQAGISRRHMETIWTEALRRALRLHGPEMIWHLLVVCEHALWTALSPGTMSS